MATKTVSEIGASNITPLNIYYFFYPLPFNNWETDKFKVLPVFDPQTSLTLKGLIGQNSGGNNHFSSNDFLMLPCPPYCGEGVSVYNKALLPLASTVTDVFSSEELNSSLGLNNNEYCQLVVVNNSGQNFLGFMAAERISAGNYSPLDLTDPNQNIVTPN